MIQDIAPLHLYNEWHNVQPEKDDWVICMQERKILVRGVQNAICFPRYAEIKSQVQNGDRFVYLFAVGEERFFLYQQHQYKDREELNLMHLCRSVENQRKNSVAEQTLLSEEEIVFHYETTRYLRGAAPQHMCYAGLVGAQLAGWYAAHRFCGGCGTRMIPDGRERMMRCPACGQMEYPKICPCVIVGVMHEGKILVSWYKNGFRDHYALIAGFTEIGETAEQTVEREVMEEVGLSVENIRYYKSQPWGYDSNLLLGYFCDLAQKREIHLDETELSLAEWVDYRDIPDDPEGLSLTREMMITFREQKKREHSQRS